MTKKLYETLGVSTDATDEEIKRAFKRVAKECHPDMFPIEGEEKEEAKRRLLAASQAKDILLDPVSRANYDETGIPQQMMSEEHVIDLAQKQIGAQFNSLLQASIDQKMRVARIIMTNYGAQQQLFEQFAPPLETTPFLEGMRNWAVTGRQQLSEALEKARRALATCRRVREGLTSDSGNQFFHEHLDKEVSGIQGSVAQIRNSLRVVEAYDRLLDDFHFELPKDWETDDFDDLAALDKPALQLTQEKKRKA